ncbi:hypothetical protein [Propionimicrobium sp. PCR01-08-3]|uniref:hypothetical protein n=1 Tax=Propionimicrobium sp. PCR01-08-3 TaxID=3052086 RepID=UPI00255C6388|nr:hypothetical protein [Propionimicrobium sp. PCR01-08-3]WIY82540.1 hypothetical protein QQ658_13710 [Propionimicrobium sp. PCR01-08-3]
MATSSADQRQLTPWPKFGSGGLEAPYVKRLIDFVNARLYMADHRALLLLKCMIAGDLPPRLNDQAVDAILGFRFSMLEAGTDSMTLWTENHQVTAAVAEYLAGQVFPDRIFTNDGRSGVRHQRAARAQLMIWMSDRFRFGFSEWLSNTYYAYDIAALAMLADHADDPGMAERAEMVIDLALLDLALNSFGGRVAPSMGRAHSEQILHPDAAEIMPVWHSAFGGNPEVDIDKLTSLFVVRERYRVPAAITELATEQPVRRVLSSQGLDVNEVRDELRNQPFHPRSQSLDLIRFWWGQQAITTPETIVDTARAMRVLELQDSRVLAPLRRYVKLPNPVLVSTLRTINPITTGKALNRANVQTVTTGNYLLSSVQRYQPGCFGDQQHIWHASLPGEIEVFGTHPGSSQLSQDHRPPTPSRWVGNGVNPDAAQHHNVLLVQHNLRMRRGYFEGPRQEMAHIHFPFVLFDQTRLGPSWVAGRRENSFIGILGTHTFELVSESEIVQRGQHTGYAVMVGDDEEYASFADFLQQLRQYRLRLSGDRLTLSSPFGRFELTWCKEFRVNGRIVESDYPRYDAPGVQVPRNPTEMTVRGTRHRLRLDWSTGKRISTAG